MMVKRKMNIFLIAVFLFSLIVGGFQAPVFAAEKTGTITVVGDGTPDSSLEKTNITFGENTTAFDALLNTVGAENVAYTDTKFITGINGINAPADFSYWWSVYVNGIALPVGADGYVMQEGDDLSFVYTDYPSSLEKTATLEVFGKDGEVISDSGFDISLIGEPTAFDLLMAQVGSANVEYHTESNGIMIDSINGTANDVNNNSFWMYYINEKDPEGGAGSYKLKNGDKITFKYVNFNQPDDETSGEDNPPSDGSGDENNQIEPIDPNVIQQAIDSAVTQIPHDSIDEWGVIALKQAGKTIPADYMEQVTNKIKEENGTFRKITDYERYTLGILAAGGDPTNVGGYNLVSSIYNGDVTMQGINGVAFALIALDSSNFDIPDNATWTREKIVQYLLDNQQEDGRWTGIVDSDIDITAMSLTALAPYKDQANVSEAISKAVNYLSAQYQNGKIDNSPATAQIIIALTALKMDPNGPLFTKNGEGIVSYLLSFQNQEKGFGWKKGGATESYPTSQSIQALAAYQFYVNGKGSVFNLPLAPQQQTVTNTAAANTGAESTAAQVGKPLPNTATGMHNTLAIGILILVLGTGAMMLGRRKKA